MNTPDDHADEREAILTKYPLIRRYLEHMPDGDDLLSVVLKGHLLLEERLDSIIMAVVAHGSLLERPRLTFAHKVALARALSWNEHENTMWTVVESLNSVRNELAHNLDTPKLAAKMQQVVNAFAATEKEAAQRLTFQAFAPTDQIRHVVVMAMGFLSAFERDALNGRELLLRMNEAVKAIDKVAQSKGDPK